MLGRIVIGKGGRDEAEKPFWISFSDLMTALMMLFLVVMTISLLSVTQKLRDVQVEEQERVNAISRIVSQLKHEADKHEGISIKANGDVVIVDFGPKVKFDNGKHVISEDAASSLRSFAPKILEMAKSDDGRRWFRRIIVEGFTSRTGDYLLNLDLSLKRAERVVCSLLDPTGPNNLDDRQKQAVRRLFLVAGFSSNSLKASDEESRRVEWRLDFRAVKEPLKANDIEQWDVPLGMCRI